LPFRKIFQDLPKVHAALGHPFLEMHHPKIDLMGVSLLRYFPNAGDQFLFCRNGFFGWSLGIKLIGKK
jgi:hypothetical protein